MFKIRRVGYNDSHNANFSINRSKGWDCYLLLYIKTQAYFTIKDKEQLVEPNTFILFNKNSAHNYRASGNEYINSWLQFDCDESFMLESILFDTPINLGGIVDIDSYFRLITDCHYSEKSSKLMTCSLLIQAMLLSVYDIIISEKDTSIHYTELINLRKQIYARPEYQWRISEMAETLFISSAHFQELYTKTFGISCGSDIIKSRIESAKNLLIDSNLQIKEIAEMCGYNSDIHFSRQFRKNVCVSPNVYRKRYK